MNPAVNLVAIFKPVFRFGANDVYYLIAINIDALTSLLFDFLVMHQLVN